MDSTSRKDIASRAGRRPGLGRVLVAIAGALGLLAAPVAAHAATRVGARSAAPRSTSVCSKVSAASVSAIVGHTVPAATQTINHLKGTKQNFGISAVVTSCTFGTVTSIASLAKDVSLQLEVTSKTLTATELKQELAQGEKVASASKFKVTITSYSGLGVPAFYFSFTADNITAQGITGIAGTRIFGASVETKSLSMSKLGALAKLAEQL